MVMRGVPDDDDDLQWPQVHVAASKYRTEEPLIGTHYL
jgi:hypothetical protein